MRVAEKNLCLDQRSEFWVSALNNPRLIGKERA